MPLVGYGCAVLVNQKVKKSGESFVIIMDLRQNHVALKIVFVDLVTLHQGWIAEFLLWDDKG
ncbi:MAG: hypothetical protein R2911_33045 [Caldilineaceae bacterium]